jgi:peptide-methionine (R)-S-oxide reductase
MDKKLTKQQHKILKEKGTEMPFTSKFLREKGNGNYHCVNCNALLFNSEDKFDSETGWPSFTNAKNVELISDNSLFIQRTEVICKSCGGHLGHVFDDGPHGKKRYCINGCILNFKKLKGGTEK